MLQQIGAPELLLVVIVLVLLFGAKKLPELARGAGSSLRIFRSEVRSPIECKCANQPVSVHDDPLCPWVFDGGPR